MTDDLSNAGGTGIFVSKKLSSSIRNDFSCTRVEFEALWIEIETDLHHNLVCGVIYRHPNNNCESFLNYMNHTVESISKENKYCIIMGDFNIDLLNVSHASTEHFLDILETNFFSPHILQPTRITHHSATLIDNIFFNSATHHTISGNIIYDLTDHLPNFLIINKFAMLPKQFKLYKRDYSNFNESAFLEDLDSINWSHEFSDSGNASLMFDQFYSNISTIVDKHIPLKQLSIREIKQLTKPWITKGLQTSIKIKNRFYKKFIKTKSLYYQDKFKYYRNRLNHLLKISKQRYYNEYFTRNHANLKKTWCGIKEIIGFKTGNNNLPSKILSPDNNEITDCHFFSFFANIIYLRIYRKLNSFI